jgi:ABC-type multidrug transport system ATPase subunit
VTKDFGTVQAVKGVDLSIAPGELFGLIGHNGAGKSTLFKMMLGLIPITSGEIRLDGEPVNGPRFAKPGARSAICPRTWCSTTTSRASRRSTSSPT